MYLPSETYVKTKKFLRMTGYVHKITKKTVKPVRLKVNTEYPVMTQGTGGVDTMYDSFIVKFQNWRYLFSVFLLS